MQVLIITKSDDNESIEFVTQAIEEKGGSVYRFDTDRFPTEIELVAHYGKGTKRLILTSAQGELDLENVTAIWHRRLNIGGQIPTSMERQIRSASVGESRVTVMGMLASLKTFRIDPVQRIRHAENKQLQIQVAREMNLEVPRTLITNSPAAVLEFAKTCENGIVTKMLSSFAVYENGKEQVVFTNPVKPHDLQELSGLRLCPMTFQEMIPKALELRVIVVGREVFSASIDSQASERATHDWRRDGIGLIEEWKSYDLPVEVKERLLRLMDYFGLNYGAIDIIVTPDSRHIFLEVNPAGEFFWLERCPGLPVSKALANVLLGFAPHRENN
ncbi:MAG TPA: MvdD family ATP-grasp ribosomal peptide maturase [Blastocatellia bacterium]|nr:MvdD family ATP-grasp ribosomal peptide maturase [Blastocatellia bacterium]